MDAPTGLLDGLLKSLVDAIVTIDGAGRILFFNPGAEQIFGYARAEAEGQSLDLLLPERFRTKHRDHVRAFERSGDSAREMGARQDIYGLRKNGEEFRANASIYRHALEGDVAFTVVLRDSSSHPWFNEAVDQLRLAFAAAGLGFFEYDHESGKLQVSPTWREIFGVEDRTIDSQGFFNLIHPDDRADVAASIARVHDPATEGAVVSEHRVLRRDGAVRWVTVSAQTLFAEVGGIRRPRRTTGVVRDITERRLLRESQSALWENEQSLLLALEAGQMGTWDWNLSTNAALWNARQRALFGVPPGDDAIPYALFMERVHPDDREGMRRVTERIASSKGAYHHEFRIVHPDGQIRWMSGWGQSLLDKEGRLERIVGINVDITERKRAESVLMDANEELEARVADRTEELRLEMKRREDMQAALAESQRLEAIGRLTGGVAHDSNNLLTVIGGNLEMLEDAIGPEHPGLKYLREAQSAVERKTQLNRRLLTVAGRRKLEARVLNINDQVKTMSELLRRVLGETITLVTTLHADLWKVALDASELDNALLNLAINARDAMPRGGRLHISTKNVVIDEEATRGEADLAPGKYVSVSVTDSGEGIPLEILPRVFEPFFTTKGQGKGTGLGLATVHGFTKQSGGHVTIYSEPGRGTTVNIYFPRHDGAELAEGERGPPEKRIADGHGDTILVVEDDAQVRAITRARLERLGYSVLEAPDGPSALALLQARERVDLVFSDIVMSGGMSGFELMSAIEQRMPHQRVLLTSGFDLDAVRNGERQFSAKVLQKPYSQHDLALAVRAALAENAPSQPARTSPENT